MTILDDLLKHCDQYEVDRAFVLACENGDLELAKQCLNNPNLAYNANIHTHGTDALMYAIDGEHPHVVEYLLSSTNLEPLSESDVNNLLTYKLTYNSINLDIVRLIIDYAKEENKEVYYQLSFHNACEVENVDVMKIFVSDKDLCESITPEYQLECFDKFLKFNRFDTVHFFLAEESLNFRINLKYYMSNVFNKHDNEVNESIQNLIKTFDFHNSLSQTLSQDKKERIIKTKMKV